VIAGIQLAGTEEAQANIRRIAAQVGDAQMRDWAVEALEPVAEEARGIVQVDQGTVRDAIEVRVRLPDGSDREFDGKAVFVGVFERNAFHAFFLEFGTMHMPAYPFITPAWDARQAEVFEILGELAGQAIEGAI
jgi:HK97 gp10 family phage protein